MNNTAEHSCDIRPITAKDIASYHKLRLVGLAQSPEAFGETAEHFMTVAPDQIHLAVVTSNYSALGLYKSLGFEIYGEDPNALKVGEMRYDEYLMVRFLREQIR